MRSFPRFLGLLRPHGRSLAAAAVAMAGVAACTVLLAALIRPLFDDFLVPAGSRPLPWHLPALLVLFALGKGACSYVAAATMGRVGQEVVAGLRVEVHRSVLAWPLERHTGARGGDLLARALADVDRLETAVSEKLAALVREGLVALALAAWLVRLEPLLALGSFLAAPLVAWSLTAFGTRARAASRRGQRELGALAAIFQESLAGIRVVKAFGMERFEAARLGAAARRLVEANLGALRVAAAAPPLMELLGGVAAGAVFIAGSGRIADGRMTVGGFTSFLTTLLLLYTPVKKVSNANHFLQGSLAAAERVFEVLDAPREPSLDAGGGALPPLRDGIRFEGVWFRFGDEWVLRGVDLWLPAGEVVALVGTSGAGKSTLANLLLRFHEPQRGRITWDGIDIRDISLGALREGIALVTQETILFHDTVARNIAYGRADVAPARIEAAARAAHADGFIGALPEGYATLLGERGERLSQGQRQRLAIARAVLKEAPVLVLDEATSSLDAETERDVQAALDRLMQGATVLLIAHRLSTVERADQIVVLEEGRVIEVGRHQDLLGRAGAYARMQRVFRAGGERR